MIQLHVITYRADAMLALACVRWARIRMPDVRVTVVDDARQPMSRELADQVESQDATYMATTWDRRGNLNGSACVRGLLETMIAGSYSDDIAIKLDADTLLRSLGPVDRMLAAGAEGFGSCFGTRAFCGLCYGFTGRALRRMLEVMDDVGVDEEEPEDMAMGRLAMAAGIRLHMELTWAASRPSARWAAYRWPTMPAVDKYDRMDVVTLGTRDNRTPEAIHEMLEVYDRLGAREVI